jgi:hypothetical protein
MYPDPARVQHTMVSYLPDSSVNHDALSLYNSGAYMLVQMQYIQQRMNQVNSIPLLIKK